MAYKARELRIVSNVTAAYDGGYSVELADGSVIAGPYAVKADAQQAKRDIVAGRGLMPVGSPRFTVVGAFSGKVFAEGISLDEAVGWARMYAIPRSELRTLPPEAELRSHEDASGIIIRRTS